MYLVKISYNGLWKLLIDNGMQKKDLIDKIGVSSTTIAKMGKGEKVSKEKTEIDELLFIHYLYKEAKKVLTKYIKQELSRPRLV